MARKRKTEASLQTLDSISKRSEALEKRYNKELETNPEYSLSVDPVNKYNMPEAQKKFIEQFVQYKSIATAAEFCGISMEEAKEYYLAYSSQVEIRRINLALYHRQFSTRLATLDELGGYLTSLLTDDNVAYADRLKTVDKLRVVQMLIDLNKLKIESLENPQMIMSRDIDVQLNSLSIKTIKQLLYNIDKPSKITHFVNETNTSLSPEENAYLSTLPTKDLLQLIEETNGGENNES